MKKIKVKSFSIKQSDALIRMMSIFTAAKENSNISLGEILFNPKKQVSVFLKIFLNYSQMISILQAFDLKWPIEIKTFFNVYSNAGGISSDVVSFDCLVKDEKFSLDAIYLKTIIFNIIPMSAFCVAFGILLLIYLQRGKSQTIRFIVVVVVTCIFLQPTIIKLLFDNLICRKIDHRNFLKEKLIVDCDEEGYKQWFKKF